MLAKLRRRLGNLSGLTIVLVLAAVLLLLFAIVPLLVLVGRSFVGPEGLTAEPLQITLNDAKTWTLLGSSLLMSVGSSLITVLIGVPSAWILARTDVPGRDVLRTALAIPYVIPPYIMAIGWITLLNPRSGVINNWIGDLLGAGPINIHSLGGMVFVLGLAYSPLVLMQTHSALMGIDPSLEEAARTSGAGTWRVIRDVTLPLTLPAIGSGALLTFLISMASFGVPYLIGNPERVDVLTTAIFHNIRVGREAYVARAVALAVMLGLVAAIALLVNRALVARGRALLGGKAGRPSRLALGKARPWAAAGLWSIVGVAVVVPLSTVVLTSLLTSWGRGFSLDNISLVNYEQVFTDNRMLQAAATSLSLAAAAATICVIIGTLASYMRSRTSLPGRKAIPFLAELPYAIPGTVLAMGLILAFSQEIWLTIPDIVYVRLLLYNTVWILLVAYSVKYLAFGVRTSDAALTQIDPSLEEAARTSGASPLRALFGVVIPLLRPALVAAWVLVFLPVIGEITMSILLVGPQTKTLGVLLFDYQTYESPPKAAVLGTLLVAMILGGNWLVKRLTGGKFGF